MIEIDKKLSDQNQKLDRLLAQREQIDVIPKSNGAIATLSSNHGGASSKNTAKKLSGNLEIIFMLNINNFSQIFGATSHQFPFK